MRRRSFSRSSVTIELFPFLSILACTIGTLILLIIVITVQTLNNDQDVTIVARTEADGKNQSKIPRYLECIEDGVIIHPSKEFVPKNNLAAPNSALTKLLSEVSANREREYFLVAIRPSGIEVFKEVRNLVEEQGIDIGYEPINETWQLKVTE